MERGRVHAYILSEADASTQETLTPRRLHLCQHVKTLENVIYSLNATSDTIYMFAVHFDRLIPVHRPTNAYYPPILIF